jgi:hypothetical protein
MPTVPLSPRPFVRDSRGNRLLRWTTVDEPGGHVLWLAGPFEAVDQVRLVEPNYVSLPISDEGRRQGWTHALRAPGAINPQCRALLDLLMSILTLPVPANVAVAITLDWYKVPDPQVDPYQWPNSETGELVYQGKYRYGYDPDRQRPYGRALADRMADVVRAHPVLNRSTAVVDVPGHDSSQVSFGSRLAASVAARLNLPMLRTGALSSFRPPAKNSDPSARAAAITGQFVIQRDLRESTILVIDDVFRSGTSVAEVARAARTAGAQAVYAIAGVRTMRGA